MPPRVKPGDAARYWREVEGLSRLVIVLERDESLEDEARRTAVTAARVLNEALITCAKASETPEESGVSLPG